MSGSNPPGHAFEGKGQSGMGQGGSQSEPAGFRIHVLGKGQPSGDVPPGQVFSSSLQGIGLGASQPSGTRLINIFCSSYHQFRIPTYCRYLGPVSKIGSHNPQKCLDKQLFS